MPTAEKLEGEGDVKLARQAVKRLRAKTKVSQVKVESIELGQDSTGDPAMWIHIALKGRVPPTSPEARRVGEFMRGVRNDLLDRGVTFRPHFRTREIA